MHLDGVLVPWVVPGGLGLRGMRGLGFLIIMIMLFSLDNIGIFACRYEFSRSKQIKCFK